MLGLKQQDKLSGLQVYSMNGEIDIEIDGEPVGSVNVEGSPLDIYEIEPGDRLITLINKSENSYKYNRIIRFVPGINTVIAYEIGPNERFSSGYLITATPSIATNESFLNIAGYPSKSKVYLNGEMIGEAPISRYSLKLDSSLVIKIENENYEELQFNLLPEDDEARSNLKGYDLNIEFRLFEMPFEVITL